MVKDNPRSSPPKRKPPTTEGGSKPTLRKPKPAGRSRSEPAGDASRNAPSHADYPDPEPPPDRVWEDRAG